MILQPIRSTSMIPVNEPYLDERESALVAKAVASGWISSSGEFLSAFEERWAAYCNRRHAVAVSNGTTALEIAVKSLGIGPGDEVIIPDFTIISCAIAVINAGATPVFVDSNPRDWTMDCNTIEPLITERTKAIMAVHMYGCPCDMDRILSLAECYKLAIIEDAAQAHGSRYLVRDESFGSGWRRCGGFGDVSCFSFYANKLITTGEGGMVLTNDDTLAASLRSLRNLAFVPQRRFLHEKLGHNFRLTNIQAALGVAQIEKIDFLINRKKAIGARYREIFSEFTLLSTAEITEGRDCVYFAFGILLDDSLRLDAAACIRALAERGIETRPFFLGMHAQPALATFTHNNARSYPVSDRLAERGLYLPTGARLSDQDIDHIAHTVMEVLYANAV